MWPLFSRQEGAGIISMTRECITLANGLQIWLEPKPDRSSASFGIWIGAGSCMERPENNGASHFLEHLYFKGSRHYTGADLAERMDAIGGRSDAYTTKDHTCFCARTLTEHVGEGLELLLDMVAEPAMAEQDFQTERGVVLEEISMVADDPEDEVVERLEQAVWRSSPYGMPILGTRESVEAMRLGDLERFRRQVYVPNRMVISVAGSFDRNQVIEAAERKFGGWQPGYPAVPTETIAYHRSCVFEEREMEQTHLCFALPALPFRHEQFWARNILNNAVGGCSSSRLFRRIREELGMAYTVDSAWRAYEPGGLLYIQAAVSPEQAERAASEITNVLREARGGITESEFRRAREWLRSSIRMDGEDTMHRAAITAEDALVHDVQPDEAILTRIDRVTREDVNRLAENLLDLSKLSVSVCGDVSRPEFYESLSVE